MTGLTDSMFKQALDRSLDIAIIMEANFEDVGSSTIIYVNQAFSEIMGYSEEEVIGQNARMLQSQETDKHTRLEIRVALKKKLSFNTRILNTTKSGNPIWLDINIVPLENEQGDVTHFLATERVASEP